MSEPHPQPQEPLIFIIAGEPSGDMLASRLMAALKAETGGHVRFAGVGGERMEREGLRSLFPMRELAIMGLFEIIRHIPRILRRIRETVTSARRLHPELHDQERPRRLDLEESVRELEQQRQSLSGAGLRDRRLVLRGALVDAPLEQREE